MGGGMNPKVKHFIQACAVCAGVLLASAEHDGGWLFLFNASGVCLVALVALTAREQEA